MYVEEGSEQVRVYEVESWRGNAPQYQKESDIIILVVGSSVFR
jgi:hypothetical protein